MTFTVNNFIDGAQWDAFDFKTRTKHCFDFGLWIQCNRNGKYRLFLGWDLSAFWKWWAVRVLLRANHSLTHFKAWRHGHSCYLSIVLSHHWCNARWPLFFSSFSCLTIKLLPIRLSKNRHTQSIRAHTTKWVVYSVITFRKIYDPRWNRMAFFSIFESFVVLFMLFL